MLAVWWLVLIACILCAFTGQYGTGTFLIIAELLLTDVVFNHGRHS